MKRIAVFLADGFEEVEAITPVDFLRRAGVDVTTVGVTGKTVTGGHGISVEADVVISEMDADSFDAIVLPGGTEGAQNISASSAAVDVVGTYLDSGKLVAAICAAPGVVLGDHGMLTDRKFTCYPGFETRGPDGQFSEERVVEDGNLITSRGPGTAAEFSLAVIRYLVDSETAESLRQGTLQPV